MNTERMVAFSMPDNDYHWPPIHLTNDPTSTVAAQFTVIVGKYCFYLYDKGFSSSLNSLSHQILGVLCGSTKLGIINLLNQNKRHWQ